MLVRAYCMAPKPNILQLSRPFLSNIRVEFYKTPPAIIFLFDLLINFQTSALLTLSFLKFH